MNYFKKIIFYIKKKISLIIIILLFAIISKFFTNIYNLYYRDYSERMNIHYGYCNKESYGYVKKIKDICEAEKIEYTNKGIEILLFNSNFDIRQCINNLECIKYMYNKLDESNVENIIDIPKIHLIKEIIRNCYEKKLNEVLKNTKVLYDSGYSANDIILTFMKYIEHEKETADFVEIYKILSEYYIKVNLIDNMTQLSACFVSIYRKLKK